MSCFACHVYLYNWEPHDEPWSEHQRHAAQCPFMRGDPTENVPLEGRSLLVSYGREMEKYLAFLSVSERRQSSSGDCGL